MRCRPKPGPAGRTGQAFNQADRGWNGVAGCALKLPWVCTVVKSAPVSGVRFVAVGLDDPLAAPLLAELSVEYSGRYGGTPS